MAVRGRLLSLLSLLLGPYVVEALIPAGDGWQWMSRIPDMNGSQFKDFASPLIQICANAYRYPDSPLHAIVGWNLSSRVRPLHSNNGGAHSLVYEEEKPTNSAAPRVIIAFRGTAISSPPTKDGLSDLCADALLWENLTISSLRPECTDFDARTLDYFSQAFSYTRQVSQAYPLSPILLTGHSLGAGLAILTYAATRNFLVISAIGFGSPATQKPLKDRGLSLEGVQDSHVIVIAHEWDEIMRTQWTGQVGLLCLYRQPVPSSCRSCFCPDRSMGSSFEQAMPTACSMSTLEMDALGLSNCDCLNCFMETHYLKTLISVVDQGIRPICQPAQDVAELAP